MTDRDKVISHFQDAIEASGKGNRWRFVRVDIIEDALELLKADQSVIDQIEWERDTAIEQLAEVDKSLGEKMDDLREQKRGRWVRLTGMWGKEER